MVRVCIKVACYLISARSAIQYGRQAAILENVITAREAINVVRFHETSCMGRVWVKVGCYLISARLAIEYGRQATILENDIRALEAVKVVQFS